MYKSKCKFLVMISLILLWTVQVVIANPFSCFKNESSCPQNLRVTLMDDVSVKISWDMCLENVKKYHVGYKSKNSSDVKKVIVDTTSIELNNLTPDTDYNVTIIADTSKRKYKSQPLNFRTLGSARPANIRFTMIDDVSVTIKWTTPLDNIEKYDILYKPMFAPDTRLKTSTVQSTSAELNGLNRNTEYTVIIAAFKAGKIYRSHSHTVKTLKSACPENFIVRNLDLRTVQIAWETHLVGVNKYEIVYGPTDSREGNTLKTYTFYKNVTLDRLLYATKYSLTVTAIRRHKRYTSHYVFKTIELAAYYNVKQFNVLDDAGLDDEEVIKRPKDFDFRQQCASLYEKFRKSRSETSYPEISRSNIVNDTFQILERCGNSVSSLKGALYVKFKNENGWDLGGLTKEWITLFSSEVFNPKFGLFMYSDEKSSTVEINPLSGKVNPNHFLYFQYLGIFTGMALYQRCHLNVSFSLPFLKTLLNRPISLNDVKLTSPEYFRSLMWILENDPSEMNWTLIAPESTEDNILRLVRNGDKIKVTDDNKLVYIRLLINWKYIKQVELQMAAFIKGFRTMVPLNIIEMFNENELQTLIGGIQIDVNFWKKNTAYIDYQRNDDQIVWFWQAVESFDFETKSRLLQFVTATPRFALDGTRKFQFKIQKEGNINKLPRASTCGNSLSLPPYPNYKTLLEKLTKVTEYDAVFSSAR